MIKTMHITGIGPHKATRLEFGKEWTEIRGPSQSGKSTILTTLAMVFWGQDEAGKPFPTDLIREGDRAEGEIVFASGTSFRRSMTASRSSTLWHNDMVTKPGEWDDSLGALAERDFVRMAVFPLTWIGLAQSAGGGRALRDLLIDAAGCTGEDILDAELQPGEPRTEAEATKARAQAKRDLAAAEGRAAEAAAAMAEIDAIPPQPKTDLDEARRISAAADAWSEYADAYEAHVAAEEQRAKAEAALEGWKRDWIALGPRPKADTKHSDTLKTARAAREAAQAALAEAEDDRRAADAAVAACHPPIRGRPDAEDAAYNDARKAYAATKKRLDAQPAGGVCPTCKRDGWSHAEEERQRLIDELARLRTEGEEAKEAKDAAEVKADEAHVAAVEDHRKQLRSLATKAKKAAAKCEAAAEALAAAREAADTAADMAQDPAAAWEARSRALGSEPKLPETVDRPETPEVAEPTEAKVAEAREAIRVAAVRDEALRMAGDQTETARKRVEDAEAAREAAVAVVERAEEVVRAIRQAPKTLEAEALDALGDTGAMGFVFTDAGGIDVTVNGLPWQRASRGELNVADVEFRRAFRELIEMDWLPIVIDNAQDWSGEWPEVPGPVWILTTAPGDELTVKEAP